MEERTYKQLNWTSRIKLETILKHGHSKKEIAEELGVHISTVYRELKRGTYEHLNCMIQRQFPKGTDFDKVTAAEVKRVETWLNNYPREILGFMSSAEAFEIAFDRAA